MKKARPVDSRRRSVRNPGVGAAGPDRHWQGTLQAGRDLRMVVKISKAGDELTAVLYSIDQGGAALPASGVTVQGTTIRFAVPGVGATFEGKLSADGTSIAGNDDAGRQAAAAEPQARHA